MPRPERKALVMGCHDPRGTRKILSKPDRKLFTEGNRAPDAEQLHLQLHYTVAYNLT